MDPKIDGDISERLLDQREQVQHSSSGISMKSGGDADTFAEGGRGGEFVVDPMMAHGNFVAPLRAEAQQPEYRDAPFAIAFVLHIAVVLFLAFGWGVSALTQNSENFEDSDTAAVNGTDGNNEGISVSLSGLLWLCILTSFSSICISAFCLQIMTQHAETLIQSSLIASCCFMAFFAMGFVTDGLSAMAILWLMTLLFTVAYAYSIWYRIPFAAANLRAALSAIQTNAGVCILAYGIAFVAIFWVVVWFLAVVGVSFKESSCSNGVCNHKINSISILLLIFSYHWTSQVIKNVLHVTISGVVGTWWFAPQDCISVWSPAIMDSFSRSTTYSFGSICMGR